jgi:hypothetical protein
MSNGNVENLRINPFFQITELIFYMVALDGYERTGGDKEP